MILRAREVFCETKIEIQLKVLATLGSLHENIFQPKKIKFPLWKSNLTKTNELDNRRRFKKEFDNP